MTRNTSSASITNSSLSPYALNDLIKVSGVSLCFFPHWLVSLGFLESESYPGALFSSGWLKTQSASPAQPPKCRYCRWPKVLREWLKVLLKKSPFSSCFFTALSYKGKKRPWKREPGKQLLLNCKLNGQVLMYISENTIQTMTVYSWVYERETLLQNARVTSSKTVVRVVINNDDSTFKWKLEFKSQYLPPWPQQHPISKRFCW